MTWNRNDRGRGRSAASCEDTFDYQRRSRDRRQENKAGQLCRQVQRTVQMSLSGECDDSVLSQLYIEAVRPAPDAGRLAILVAFASSDAAVPLQDLLARLEGVRPWLRREIARSIVRKRGPEVAFQLVSHREEAGEADYE